MPRAKVFISCGQRRDSDEINTAHRIAERLREMGYDPYIAVEEQTLRGLKENLFSQLSTSEYMVFVDFKREQLDSGPTHRGSLFCHQELAIASFLDIPLVAFQEIGVKKDDGILKFLQGNCILFGDRHTLPSVIADTITQRRWSPEWKNQLRLVRESGQYADAIRYLEKESARFFHITVQNLNIHKQANNCFVYLEDARNLTTGEPIH